MDAVETADFGPLTITYDGRVLRPRAWTIAQSDWAIELHRTVPRGPILELCAGAGQIGLVVAFEIGRPLVQVEADAIAAQFALTNARIARVNGYHLRCNALSAAVSRVERFPMIIADPPYVRTSDLHEFPDDPPSAIDGGPDGLAVIRQCIDVADRTLVDGGAMLLQVRGMKQVDGIEEWMRSRHMRLLVTETRAVDDDRAVALLRRA